MLWIHPVYELLTLSLALYVLFLGWRRFSVAFLGRRGPIFPWKQHVLWGQVALTMWLLGLGLGLSMAWLAWQVVFISGLHYQVALAMVPLIIFGQVSGYVMDKHKAKRKALPLAHGLNNLLLVGLALMQLTTGIGLIIDMVLP